MLIRFTGAPKDKLKTLMNIITNGQNWPDFNGDLTKSVWVAHGLVKSVDSQVIVQGTEAHLGG
jgi:hypothetical protein